MRMVFFTPYGGKVNDITIFLGGFCNGPDGVGRCHRSTFLLLLRTTSIGLVRISGALLSLVEIP